MSTDIRILHFRMPCYETKPIANNPNYLHSSTPPPTAAASLSSEQLPESSPSANALAKFEAHEWMCQLSIQEDTSTIRVALPPLAPTDSNRLEFRTCCSLQVTTAAHGAGLVSTNETSCNEAEVLVSKKIKSEDLFERSIECKYFYFFYLDGDDVLVDRHYEFQIILSSLPLKLLGPPNGANWTHTLALSESDPAARNVDPLVEMMTQFERHAPTSDVEIRFVSKAGLMLDRMRAHHAVLSIYPAFSQKLLLALTQGGRQQHNPHQRSVTPTVLTVPVEAWATFERMLGFIYSGRLPREGLFGPRSDQWRINFQQSQEYGLLPTHIGDADNHHRYQHINNDNGNKWAASCAVPWMVWHLNELRQVITNDNVLELYFGWGLDFVMVAEMCVRHVADRSQMQHGKGRDLGTYVMEQLKGRYQGRRGSHEFQEALVALLMKTYAGQRH
ncbi:hypothetical protein BGZ98_007123 [Dissophora globulifera]|nr:hypothetical protein BGZ98_007123 [Dissophora globulifera]